VNAARKQTYGEIARMPHEQLGLPAGFANLFFRHESSSDDGPMTLEQVDEEIVSLETQIAEMKALRANLQAEVEQQAKAEAEKAAEKAALAALEKAAAEAAQKVAEAKARIAALPA
jgi:predicted RNase H-like nuclease (RuvC/YqgF family)